MGGPGGGGFALPNNALIASSPGNVLASLTSLDLNGNQLRSAGMLALGGVLRLAPQLKELSIADNELGPQAILNLSTVVSHVPDLQVRP